MVAALTTNTAPFPGASPDVLYILSWGHMDGNNNKGTHTHTDTWLKYIGYG